LMVLCMVFKNHQIKYGMYFNMLQFLYVLVHIQCVTRYWLVVHVLQKSCLQSFGISNRHTCICFPISGINESYFILYIVISCCFYYYSHRSSGIEPQFAAHISDHAPALHSVCPTYEYSYYPSGW
jgi:hypothetical protein